MTKLVIISCKIPAQWRSWFYFKITAMRVFRHDVYNVKFSVFTSLLSHCLVMAKLSFLSNGIPLSTFYQVSLEFSQSRTHIPSGGGCGDVRPLQGPLRSASISLPWLTAPLPPGAQGSTLHNGPGPSQYNMSDRWIILRLWASFYGHVRGRSLLLTRTSCGTRMKITNPLQTRIESFTIW